MATLHTLFYARRAALQRQLERAATPRELTERLRGALDELQAAFVEELTPDQARLAIAFVETIRLSTAAMATGVVRGTGGGGSGSAGGRAAWSGLLLLALQVCVGLGLAVSLAVQLPATWLPLLLLILLGGLALLRHVDSAPAAGSRVQGEALDSSGWAGEFRIDAHALLDHVANALGVVDQAVALHRPPQDDKPAPTELERLGDIVDFLHQLTGPAMRGNSARLLEVAEPLRQLLARHGLRIDEFRDQEAGDQAKWIAQPARDPEAREYVMLAPALMGEDGRVVRAGRVCVPAREDVEKKGIRR